jgi:hypothetical protein
VVCLAKLVVSAVLKVALEAYVITKVEKKRYSKEYRLPRVAAGIKRRYCMQSRHCNLSVHEWITTVVFRVSNAKDTSFATTGIAHY